VQDIAAAKVVELIGKHDIPIENVVCLVTDNEPTMNAMANHLPFPWMGCFDHLVEIVTGSCFDNNKIAMANARGVVTFFNHSSQAEERLLSLQKQNDPEKKPLTLIQDVGTRWWSTFTMCDRLNSLKSELQYLYYKKEFAKLKMLDEKEWDYIEEVKTLLEPFMIIQKYMEGSKYITISLIPLLVYKMRAQLQEQLIAYNGEGKANIIKTISDMLTIIAQRWGSGKPGTVLDEHKTRGYKQIRKGIPYHALLSCAVDPRLKNLLPGIPIEEHEKLWELVEAEMKLMYKKINENSLKEVTSSSSSTAAAKDVTTATLTQPLVEKNKKSFDLSSLISEFQQSSSSSSRTTVEQHPVEEFIKEEVEKELRSYRNEKVTLDVDKDDPLEWWKGHKHFYPMLSMVARKFLCIPATSASSERMFSSAGNTVTDHRCCLNTDNVEALVFLHDSWKTIEEYQQKRSKKQKTSTNSK
jgi:hypothetical protein